MGDRNGADKRKADHRSTKKREKPQLSADGLLKLSGAQTAEEKVGVLLQQVDKLLEEKRTNQKASALLEKQVAGLLKEKERYQAEQGKAILARSCLESLCRELQRQNKDIKNDTVVRMREEDERRKEMGAKFQAELNDITAMMQRSCDKNDKLRDDSLAMAKKFQELCLQFKAKEEEICQMAERTDLERKLADAAMTKAKLEAEAERELLKERIAARDQQVSFYVAKFTEFEQTMVKSGEAVERYKKEITNMSRLTSKLKQEEKTWKERWEKTNSAFVELYARQQAQAAEVSSTNRKLEQLQKLCRQLQADRSAYLGLLQKHNIDVDSKPA